MKVLEKKLGIRPVMYFAEKGFCYARPWGDRRHPYLEADCQPDEESPDLKKLRDIKIRYLVRDNGFGRFHTKLFIANVSAQIPNDCKEKIIAFKVMSPLAKLYCIKVDADHVDGRNYHTVTIRLYAKK